MLLTFSAYLLKRLDIVVVTRSSQSSVLLWCRCEGSATPILTNLVVSWYRVQSTELRRTTGKSCKLLLEERSTHDTVDSTVSLGWISGTGIEWLLLPVGGLHTSRSIPSSGLDRPRMLWELLLRDRRRVLQGRGVVAHRTSPARLQRFWPLGKRFQAGIQIFAYPAP